MYYSNVKTNGKCFFKLVKMKDIKRIVALLTLVLVTVVIVSCKETKNEKVDVIEDQELTELPNKSDIAFDKAMTALDKKDYKIAGEHLATGVKDLKEEAKTKGATSKFKANLDTSIKHLFDISKQLRKGEKTDADGLRNMIANAEINVAHDYLVTDDMYVLTAPDKVNESKLHKALGVNLKNLETGTSELKGEAKKAGEKLEAEGEKLKKDYEAWKKRAEAHAKKAETFFKEYKPHIN